MTEPDAALEALRDGVLSGDRGSLARAITLMETELPADRARAERLLAQLLPHTGAAFRVGITGPPGAGKSTLVDALGALLVEESTLAVLAIDPSSGRTGGSILGDKTRMGRLSRHPGAFIRPSPSGTSQGGVARATRESMLVCEAAGFGYVFVETVGVGQSETAVADFVDFVMVLVLPGSGDELQGIKRGLLERADLVVVTKTDGEGVTRAETARTQYETALRWMRPERDAPTPPVLACSAVTGRGLDAILDVIRSSRERLLAAGELDGRRRRQQLAWMWSAVQARLLEAFRSDAGVRSRVPALEAAVLEHTETPLAAADELVKTFLAAREDPQKR